MSTIVRVSCAPAHLPPLSLVAGLAVAEAIEPDVGVPAKSNGRMMCGSTEKGGGRLGRGVDRR